VVGFVVVLGFKSPEGDGNPGFSKGGFIRVAIPSYVRVCNPLMDALKSYSGQPVSFLKRKTTLVLGISKGLKPPKGMATLA